MDSGADIGAAIDRIIADRLRVDQAEFGDETPFTGDALNADSLAIVETAEAIEANLGVRVPDETLQTVETIGELKAYVREQHPDR